MQQGSRDVKVMSDLGSMYRWTDQAVFANDAVTAQVCLWSRLVPRVGRDGTSLDKIVRMELEARRDKIGEVETKIDRGIQVGKEKEKEKERPIS